MIDPGALIIFVGYAAALAYLPLQAYAAIKWRGPSRIAALLPLFLMVPVVIGNVIAFAQQSNLWPLLLIFAAPLATAYLLITMAIRRFSPRSG